MSLLKFSNPTFNDGINLTVRLGTKWAGCRRATVELGGGYTTFVPDIHSKVLPFNELTVNDLIHEHDPICRTPEGLAKIMKQLYPEFKETDIVTLLHFMLHFRTPAIGDKVYAPDMAPVYVGSVQKAFKLNDRFWELEYMGEHFKTGDERWGSLIVHETQWHLDIGGRDNHGWYNEKS